MENRENFICFKCKHENWFSTGCAAFPEGIPDEILLSNKHSEPLPGQKNNLVFEEGKSDDELFLEKSGS